mgnify:CR=1 FL=1
MTESELNEAVAREVMGFQHREHEGGSWFGRDGAPMFYVANHWNPCQNWAHTGMVLDRMTELGWFYSFQQMAAGKETVAGSEVCFYTKAKATVYGNFYPGTPIKEAICRAALEAVKG